MKNWKDFVVNVGGIEFRPVSMGSLTLLYSVGSPFVNGGDVDATDYAVFAWLHGAPLMEVICSVKAGTYYKKALIWASEVPTEVFSSYTVEALVALSRDLSRVFIDKETGFIPFPRPSQCKPSWLKRVWTFITRLWKRG